VPVWRYGRWLVLLAFSASVLCFHSGRCAPSVPAAQSVICYPTLTLITRGTENGGRPVALKNTDTVITAGWSNGIRYRIRAT